MAGLGPAIHVFAAGNRQDVDGRPAPAMTVGTDRESIISPGGIM
jgi:hypothetical protein